MDGDLGAGDGAKQGGAVKRPMNAFLIFCKRHRALVHQKNPHLDNRSVTRILGDLWANLSTDEKSVYTNLAKEYKEAFLKANPNYKWYNPEKHGPTVIPGKIQGNQLPGSIATSTGQSLQMPDGITPGKLADPSDMGGLSMLLMAGQQSVAADGRHGIVVNTSEMGKQAIRQSTSQPSDVQQVAVSGSPLTGVFMVPLTLCFPTNSVLPKAVPSSSSSQCSNSITDSPMDLSRTADVGSQRNGNSGTGGREGIAGLVPGNCGGTIITHPSLSQINNGPSTGNSFGLPLTSNFCAASSVSTSLSSNMNSFNNGSSGNGSNMMWLMSCVLDHLDVAANPPSCTSAKLVPVAASQQSRVAELAHGLMPTKVTSVESSTDGVKNGLNFAQNSAPSNFPRTKKQLAAGNKKMCDLKMLSSVSAAESSSPANLSQLSSVVNSEFEALTFGEIQEKLITKVVQSGSLSSLFGGTQTNIPVTGDHLTSPGQSYGHSTSKASVIGSNNLPPAVIHNSQALTESAAPAKHIDGGFGPINLVSAQLQQRRAQLLNEPGSVSSANWPPFVSASARSSNQNANAPLNVASTCHTAVNAAEMPSASLLFRAANLPLISQSDVHRLIERVISETDSTVPVLSTFTASGSTASSVSAPANVCESAAATESPSTIYGKEIQQDVCDGISKQQNLKAPDVTVKKRKVGACLNGVVKKPKLNDGVVKHDSEQHQLCNQPESNLLKAEDASVDVHTSSVLKSCSAGSGTSTLHHAVDSKPSTGTAAGTELKFPSNEINNNLCHRDGNGVSTLSPASRELSSHDTGLRKSKRSNRGRRYNELVSQGILHPGRKQSSFPADNKDSGDNKDNVDSQHSDELPDAEDVTPELTETDLKCTDRLKRFKSGEFDLEAQIASLPPCHIATTERKPSSRVRSRSQSLTSSKCSASEVSSAELKSGVDWLNVCELRHVVKQSVLCQHNGSFPVKRSNAAEIQSVQISTAGSQRRKPAKTTILHLVSALPEHCSERNPPSAASGPGSEFLVSHTDVSPKICASVSSHSSAAAADSYVSASSLNTPVNLLALADAATSKQPNPQKVADPQRI